MRPEGMSLEFTQDADSSGIAGSLGNFLKLEFIDGYLVIVTERWALDADEVERFAGTLRWMLANCKDTMEEGR